MASSSQAKEKKSEKILKGEAAKAAPAQALPSRVESFYLARSGRQLRYEPRERISIIEVPNFPSLGRLTALRFIEWVQDNPDGVISLPTGKTPEYFIKWTKHFLGNWTSKAIQDELKDAGIDGSRQPVLTGLHFVQIDEFYPIDPGQRNSFYYYVNKHYIRGFGLDPKKALLIDPTSIGIPAGHTIDTVFPGGKVDLSLRHRNPTTPLETMQQKTLSAVDQFCSDYEERIRELGGIGFFLGGIGPDGHIGFNARGSHLHSPTRLTLTNYETEAAAAGDLGGIEVSRNKPVITVGLGTIAYDKNAVVIIFAAGDAKSKVVADAVHHDRSVDYPASVLQGMPNARFYLTTGATVKLTERRIEDIVKSEHVSDEALEMAVINRSIATGLRLDELTAKHVGDDRVVQHFIQKSGKQLPELAKWARKRILEKIDRGMDDLQNETILHTGPHHDDIMLGYMPYVMHLVRRASNKNYFNVLTSGFTAVTNKFLAEIFEDCLFFLNEGDYDNDLKIGEFFPENAAARAAEVYRFLDGIASRDEKTRRRAQARRMLFNLMTVYEEEDFDNIKQRIEENLHYLRTMYPGKKDIPQIQKLKGMQREFEEELIWGYVGTSPNDVFHTRLGFYTGDIFTEQPTMTRDVAPVLALLEKLKPTIVSLAFDPEGSGPDTHYKVLQVLHEALTQYNKKTGKTPLVWGYRNVWFRFHPAEANVFVPATLNTIAIMNDSFMHCFGSQKNASFPSYEYDGPFCYQAQALMVEQFRMLQTCLGERFFTENESPRLRATRGFVFLKSMKLEEFSGNARSLAQATEAYVSS
ncbi:glucosamine-6-phosphate deaminase [soil metagenome]